MSGAGPSYPKNYRYQVMADEDPWGNKYTSTDDYRLKKSAEKRADEMRRLGYKGVSVWDTLDNPVSRALGADLLPRTRRRKR